MENFNPYRMTKTQQALHSRGSHPANIACHRTMVDIFNIDFDNETLNIDVEINIFTHSVMTPPLPILDRACVDPSFLGFQYETG